MVDVVGVTYRVGGAAGPRILDDVTARFAACKFNAIIGPNGAGKSTLLRVATGLLRPSAGEVRYGDRPVAAFRADELARTRAVLSQHVELAFPLPVEDVVLMGRYPHYGPAPTSRDRNIVSRALELVGMVEKRRQPYPTLSGGEQQKVQLARVLAQIWNLDGSREHKYLFLDEPTTSLDVHYQLHLLEVARDLLAHNCTVIAVLHDLNIAFQYGQQLFVIDGGRLAYETSRPSDVSAELIERVFRVRATRVGEDGHTTWRFMKADKAGPIPVRRSPP